MGTPKNPVKVFSLDSERIMGCTGFPIDSHEWASFVLIDDRQPC
jgi:cytochrome c oxidase subunit 5b